MAKDMLSECKTDTGSLSDFQAAFCSRCINPECSRSSFGSSHFDKRIATWEKRLFTDVPKMPKQDPRYLTLANQNFLPIEVGRTPEVSSNWISPNDPSTMKSAEPNVIIPVVKAEPQIIQVAQQKPNTTPKHMLLANTPASKQGVMLSGHNTQPERDSWATPEPPKDPVVPVGGRVRLGVKKEP
jgi:hypothetical protein